MHIYNDDKYNDDKYNDDKYNVHHDA